MDVFLLWWVLPTLTTLLISAQIIRYQQPFITSNFRQLNRGPCEWTEGEALLVGVLSIFWPLAVGFASLIILAIIWEFTGDTKWAYNYLWSPIKKALCKDIF